MEDKDYKRIVRYRNEASITLDDLVALIRNSTLANDLRLFSDEVMELKPGFAFTLKQAQDLKNLTSQTLKQYKSHVIGDDELMSYHSKAQMILQGKEQMNGGRQMGILNKIIHGKEIKRQTKVDDLQQRFSTVRNQIMTCEQEMNRCVKESRGLAPDSMKYRDNERNYVANKNKLILLRKQEEMLQRTLDEVVRRDTIKEFSGTQEAISKAANVVLGDIKETEMFVAGIEVGSEKIRNTLDQSEGLGTNLFEEEEAAAARTDSGFGALVAAEERKQTSMESAGMTQEEIQKIDEEARSEFASIVDAAEKEEK